MKLGGVAKQNTIDGRHRGWNLAVAANEAMKRVGGRGRAGMTAWPWQWGNDSAAAARVGKLRGRVATFTSGCLNSTIVR